MLTIVVGAVPSFDEAKQEFVEEGGTEVQLEHSLVSLSKWESKHEKPFLGRTEKTTDEVYDYIKAMILTPGISDELLSQLSEENVADINKYIEAKMTATWFSDSPGAPRTSEVITAELIYYWMTVFNIPFECETWHLNKLFTLIRVCNNKQAKPKKMTRSEIAARNREINERRKRELGTKG